MFLLVSVRHVGAHSDEHQHGVSLQISINLGKTFLRISHIQSIPLTWNLARVFAYLPPFISQILDLSIERFWFLFWSILNGVTLKTSNIRFVPKRRNHPFNYYLSFSLFWILLCPATSHVKQYFKITVRGLTDWFLKTSLW